MAVLSVFIQLPISLGLALLLARGIKGERFLGYFFLPVLLSTVVVGQLWKKIYFPSYGILNFLLNSIGLENMTRDWLGILNCINCSVYSTALAICGLSHAFNVCRNKSISPDLREAAQIDGATEGQVSRHIITQCLANYQSLFNFAVTGSLKALT